MPDIRISGDGRGGFWALAYRGDQIFRQHGWTEDEAIRKVRADLARIPAASCDTHPEGGDAKQGSGSDG